MSLYVILNSVCQCDSINELHIERYKAQLINYLTGEQNTKGKTFPFSKMAGPWMPEKNLAPNQFCCNGKAIQATLPSWAIVGTLQVY